MIFLSWIENVRDEDIINIREEYGDIYFSVKYPKGRIRSIAYSAIEGLLADVHIYQTRMALANEELHNFNNLSEEHRLRLYGRTVLTPERVLTLENEITTCEAEIEKYSRLANYFDQKVERFKAGLFVRPVQDESSRQQVLEEDDTDLLQFRSRCESEKLAKGKTIPRERLHSIMLALGLFNGSLGEFTPESKAYKKGREYASRLGYARRGSATREK